MKRMLAVLSLISCAHAHAEIQTWSVQGADLIIDESIYSWLAPGPGGSLSGSFQYDTVSQTITSFDLRAGETLFSSKKPETDNCPFAPCAASAAVQGANKLVFDLNLTPANNRRLELFLSKPLNLGGSITLDRQSVIYYDYGLSTIHVLGGSIAPFASAAFAAPEPSGIAAVLSGLAAVAWLRASRRRSLSVSVAE